MSRNIKDRLYIATVCAEHKEIAKKYGIGTELDQFCQAEKMDEPLIGETCAEIDGILSGEEVSSGGEQKTFGGTQKTSDGEQKTFGGERRWTLHAPFSEIYPAAIDPKARIFAMQRLRQAASLAVKYKADKMIVHSGYVPLVFYKEWHEDRSVEFWEEFMSDRNDGLEIAIENVMDDEPYMIEKLMRRIKAPAVKMCLDVGHAACISEVPVIEWLEVLAPYIGHIHIHNNDGTHDWHRPVFDGKVDMEAFLDRTLKICGEDVTFAIESLEGISSMEWLKERGYLGQHDRRVSGECYGEKKIF